MTAGETHQAETHQAIEATFRIERARLIAGLARIVRNVDLAEELAQDALVVALSEWPRTGVPANPGAWLMAVAKRRAVDAIEAAMDDDLGDELLGLIFTACHPMLSPDARAALTLKARGKEHFSSHGRMPAKLREKGAPTPEMAKKLRLAMVDFKSEVEEILRDRKQK